MAIGVVCLALISVGLSVSLNCIFIKKRPEVGAECQTDEPDYDCIVDIYPQAEVELSDQSDSSYAKVQRPPANEMTENDDVIKIGDRRRSMEDPLPIPLSILKTDESGNFKLLIMNHNR